MDTRFQLVNAVPDGSFVPAEAGTQTIRSK
jgi:hypothetical protein